MNKFFLVMFCIVLGCFARAESVDSLLKVLPGLDTKKAGEVEDRLMIFMYNATPDSGKVLSTLYLGAANRYKLTSLKIKTFIHSYRFYEFSRQIAMLNEAERLADSSGQDYHLEPIYTFKAIVYRDASVADSAMMYALRSMDRLKEMGIPEDSMATILTLIADMHFYAGEYNDAEIYYNKVLSAHASKPKEWHIGTLQNNLGLIRIQQKRYEEAEAQFLKTLEFLNNRGMSSSDSTGLVYLFRKLMEVNLLMNKPEKAEEYYKRASELALRFHDQREITGIYIGKGELLFREGKYAEALKVLRKAEELEARLPDLKYKADMYKVFTGVFAATNDYKNENLYLEKLMRVNKTSDSLLNRTKILHLYAQHNYINSLKQIENIKRENTLLFLILVLIGFSLAIFVVYFIRLRNSYRVLISKNLQLANVYNAEPIGIFQESGTDTFNETEQDDGDTPPEVDETPEDKIAGKNEPDSTIINNIITRLEKLILEEKVYLDGSLTAYKLAEMLSTNRTYLGKAIHQKYNMNFNDYLNGHRVKEAIRLIAAGENKIMGMDGIGQKAGFNNRVTFTKAFQQHTGVSPSYFAKNMTENRESLMMSAET